MLAEFLELNDIVRRRAVFVGQAVIEWKHYALYQAKVVFLNPLIAGIQPDYVDLLLGELPGGPIAVRIPALLFESGSVGDIRTWVTQQNNAHREEQDIQTSETRTKEITMLQELKAKYPLL